MPLDAASPEVPLTVASSSQSLFTTSTPQLFPELYRMIVEFLVDSKDDPKVINKALCSLARTSRTWQIEAERVLYRTITFPHGERYASRINRVLNDRAAEYVEHLSIKSLNISIERIRLTRSSTQLPFHRMRKLKSLTLPDTRTHVSALRPLLKLVNDTLPRDILREFSAPLLILTSKELHFLRKQTRLLELHTTRIPQDLALMHKFAPLLQSVTIKGEKMKHSILLFNFRPILSLRFDLQFCHRLDATDVLPQNCIKVLMLSSCSAPTARILDFLDLRIKDCPHVRYLSFYLNLGRESHQISTTLVLDPLVNKLDQLRALEAVQIHFEHPFMSRAAITQFFQNHTSRTLRSLLLVFQSSKTAAGPVELRQEIEGQPGWITIQNANEAEWSENWKRRAMDDGL
ncbi:hypothetical protein SISSUDRAFT_1047477 [Sistotremastrum suecicum HHB10207 ss-3]|uniref:F-box domain-containing protein n=1 Tax=Sistotremastrum suecicum HHB10207 ss-3 TaxID=1314776 RepID=A0A166D481_9AGAM|nr:hypothetical protein SISSUDRAFT_1047477 [Sistotremastrum suecicum HHB10207 ss-3]